VQAIYRSPAITTAILFSNSAFTVRQLKTGA